MNVILAEEELSLSSQILLDFQIVSFPLFELVFLGNISAFYC